MSDDPAYLYHIVAAISDVENYTAGGKRAFFDQEIIQDAVMVILKLSVKL